MKRLRITVDGIAYDVTVEVLEDAAYSSSAAFPRPAETSSAGISAPAPAPAPATSGGTSAAGPGVIPSPMTGTVLKILAKPGDHVSGGQPLLILEAMKMETPVAAMLDAVVKEILVKEGDSVQEGQPLLRLN